MTSIKSMKSMKRQSKLYADIVDYQNLRSLFSLQGCSSLTCSCKKSLVNSYRLESLGVFPCVRCIRLRPNQSLVVAGQRLPSNVHHLSTTACPGVGPPQPQNTIPHDISPFPRRPTGSILLTHVVGVEKRGYYQSMNYAVYGVGSGSLVLHLEAFWSTDMAGIWYISSKIDNHRSLTKKAQIPFAATALLLLVVSIPSRARLTAMNGIKDDQKTAFLQNYDWWGSMLLHLLRKLSTLTLLFGLLTTGGSTIPWIHPIEIALGIPILPICPPRTTPKGQPTPPHSLPRLHPHQRDNLIDIRTTKDARAYPPASQALLALGTLALFVVVACTSAHTRLPESIYNLALLLPTLGMGMMAPSAVLTLLSSSTKDDHAVANGCFIMMRSLGVFMAVAAGTTTLQNVFEGTVAAAQQTIEGSSREMIESARHTIEMIPTLPEPERSIAFAALFGICVISAGLIVLSLKGVRVQALEFGEYGKQAGSETAEEEGSFEMERTRP
ncbi:uncharacterized protein BO95DRAFT_433012 [Aspergillus brunneoviolaceus CBS 621.78]|uniref:Uncharacterized protein n=1 Tax=Aspergillus brunneoviolaceus CBS 621.78 TaxID=1450534 RepID=A0ACD1G5I1_9EURO|nr:hypothetical protein BO95DRAFT_433012 [Aspergillus brunneoviolaceus CBS 621.78]RAH44418.1 hypothetical protein BO95DRAFT_433012 [Aspergillus brunneoviolaceus CBS 621.78]